MTLEEAKKFIGKEVMYSNLTGKLIRVARLSNGMIIGEADNGVVVNIDLLKILDIDGQWKFLT